MSDDEVLFQIERLKARVKEIVSHIQYSKKQLEKSELSLEEFRAKKDALEQELRLILRNISRLKESIQFSQSIEKQLQLQFIQEEREISEKATTLMYYFQSEFEELVNKANIYLSGFLGDISIELGFFELFYPPVAQKNKPFNVTGLIAHRGANGIEIAVNLDSLKNNYKDIPENSPIISLKSEQPKALTFKVKSQKTSIYSLKAILKKVNGKEIMENNKIFFDFEVKVLPFEEKEITTNDFFDTKTGRYLIFSYLACEKEEVELLQELKINLEDLGVNSFGPLMKIIPQTVQTQNLLELGRYINETIIFLINNFEKIQNYYKYEKIDDIEKRLLLESENLFKFAPVGIILKPFENLENALQLSMVFRTFFKICKLGLRKLFILKTMLSIGREYGYDISKYFLYIKSIKKIPNV
ncbi:MAG: hypothetical protein ACTSQJ_03620 [Promethearchaeota archaeon]